MLLIVVKEMRIHDDDIYDHLLGLANVPTARFAAVNAKTSKYIEMVPGSGDTHVWPVSVGVLEHILI